MVKYCGECQFFKHEDADGHGICDISGRAEECSLMCEIELNTGTYKAIRLLRKKIKEYKL